MRILISIGLFALVLFALRDSSYWALVIVPYGALQYLSGLSTGLSAVIHRFEQGEKA